MRTSMFYLINTAFFYAESLYLRAFYQSGTAVSVYPYRPIRFENAVWENVNGRYSNS